MRFARTAVPPGLPVLCRYWTGAGKCVRRRSPAGLINIISIIILYSVLHNHSVSAQSLRVLEASAQYDPIPDSRFFEDPSGALQFAEIRNMPDEQFQAPQRGMLNFGYSSSAFWVKFKIQKNPGNNEPLLLEINNPTLDRVDLFYETEPGTLHKFAGDIFPFSQREIKNRNLVFVLNPDSSTTEVYLRFRSEGAMFVDMSIGSWEQFYEKDHMEQYVLGLYYGILLLILFLNVFIYLFVKDKNYLIYILYVFFYGIFQLSLNGIAYQYFWPNSPRIANYVTPVFSGVCIMLATVFARRFLLSAVYTPFMDKLMQGVLLAASVMIAISPFVPYHITSRFAGALGISFAVTVLLSATIVFTKGYRPARFFLIAWGVFLTTVIAFALFMDGVIPNMFMMKFMMQIGSALHMVLISMGLADRMYQMKKETDAAQLLALEEHINLARLKGEMNIRLEREVKIKTSDLESAMSELKRREMMVHKELDLAHDIQKGLMPGEFVEMERFRFASRHRYLTKVGGDFYDYYAMGRQKCGLLLADVSGHGIPAALVTSVAKICFLNATTRTTHPSKIFTMVNKEILRSVSALAYLTAFFFTLDDRNNVVYSAAAHQNPMVYRKKENRLDFWDADGFLLGCMEDVPVPYLDRYDKVAPGDRILMYTDGVVQSRNGENEEYGMERLKTSFLKSIGLSVQEARDYLFEDLDRFLDGQGADDDVTVFLIEIKDDAKKSNSKDKTAGRAADALI